ncbi:hypothetical protein BDZ45DRAFT_674960 [Acephala macrosclerotiorum]|nr:hypothetical protein BDZ45DRAFT_674960 [Acephala macrosclerotiorum]
MTKEEKFAQEVTHLLGRANAMKSEVVSNYYEVFLLTAHNMELSISTCRVSDKYLHRLQTRLPRSIRDSPVVHRYGPVDIFDTAQRVEAVCTIYKLMFDRATTISKERRA